MLIEEDLHTAFFTYILNSDNKLLKYLLVKLLNKESNLINTIPEDNFDYVTTQVSEAIDGQYKYPDMKITTIDDTEGTNEEEERSQLNNYLKLAKRNSSKENFLLYLTKYNESISQETEEHPSFSGQFTWSMVSDIIDDYIKKQPTIDSEKYNLIIQIVQFGCGKKFYEKVENEFSKDLKKAEDDLEKNYPILA